MINEQTQIKLHYTEALLHPSMVDLPAENPKGMNDFVNYTQKTLNQRSFNLILRKSQMHYTYVWP